MRATQQELIESVERDYPLAWVTTPIIWTDAELAYRRAFKAAEEAASEGEFRNEA